MKKILILLTISINLFAKSIIVGATPTPYAQILNDVKEIKQYIQDKGYDFKVVVFNDYIIPNKALEAKEIDANIFQHEPFLINFNQNKGTHLSKLKRWIVSPLGIYSIKHQDLVDKTKLQGATISIPNDPTNESRALELLSRSGLITVDETSKLKTPKDIINNPYNLKFTEIEATQLPRTLGDVDFAVIPGNYALGAKLDVKNAIILEDKDLEYANMIVAVRDSEINDEKFQILWDAITQPAVKDYIQNEFKGVIIPRF